MTITERTQRRAYSIRSLLMLLAESSRRLLPTRISNPSSRMELLAQFENDVLKQKEEENKNLFSTSSRFREFILSSQPDTDVNVALVMCCLQAERLNGGHGTRVTLVDETLYTEFEPTANALNDVTPLKRKPYLVQVTVWDAKPQNESYGKNNLDFHPGAIYKFRQVDGVGFYADIAKGNVQYERQNTHKISEIKAPLKKRKNQYEPATKAVKSKLQNAAPSRNAVVSKVTGDDESMEPEGEKEDICTAVTTRSKCAGEHP